jgi:hypothetical protein
MSHPNKPEYFTLTSICEYDGSQTTHGIFENIDAVYYRMKQMYTRCGSEYHIECFHLSDAESEAKKWSEENVQRRSYQRQEEMKEARLQEWQEYKDKEDEQMIEDCKNNQPDEDEDFDEVGFNQMMEGDNYEV